MPNAAIESPARSPFNRVTRIHIAIAKFACPLTLISDSEKQEFILKCVMLRRESDAPQTNGMDDFLTL